MSKIYDKEYGLPSQYLLNKKKRPAKTDGKYLYYYVGASISDFPKGSKLKKCKNAYVCEIEVSLEEWQCLLELDKAEYNANHKEDRHQDSYQNVENINGREEISEDVELSTVLGIDKEILSLHKQGYTQQEITEKLKVTQGHVSKRLIKIKDKIEDGEADGTLSSIERKVEKFWDEFIAKRKMPDYFDVMVDAFMAGLPSVEYERLLKWFYSYREFLRWTLKYLLIYEDKLIDEKMETALLKKLPKEQREIYQEVFEEADALDSFKMTYLILAVEVERRKETFKEEPKGNAFVELNNELERIAKLKKVSVEEYLEKYFIPEFLQEKEKRYASYRENFEREYPNVLIVDEDDPRSIEEQLIEKFGDGEKPVVKRKKINFFKKFSKSWNNFGILVAI